MNHLAPKLILITLCFLFFGNYSAMGQIESIGFNGFKWGTKNKDITLSLKCEASFADAGFENCFGDSLLLLNKYPAEFVTYRFFKRKFTEVSMDFDREHLDNILHDLNHEFGPAKIKETRPNNNPNSPVFTFYQWNIGKTWFLIFDKGPDSKVWAICASRRLREIAYIGKENYIENLLHK